MKEVDVYCRAPSREKGYLVPNVLNPLFAYKQGFYFIYLFFTSKGFKGKIPGKECRVCDQPISGWSVVR